MEGLWLSSGLLQQIVAYPKEDVGKPLPMEPDPEADEDDDDEVSPPSRHQAFRSHPEAC